MGCAVLHVLNLVFYKLTYGISKTVKAPDADKILPVDEAGRGHVFIIACKNAHYGYAFAAGTADLYSCIIEPGPSFVMNWITVGSTWDTDNVVRLYI